jgi:hypothetical protein
MARLEEGIDVARAAEALAAGNIWKTPIRSTFRPRLSRPHEEVQILLHEFQLDWSEYEQMPAADLWRDYVGVMLIRISLEAQEIQTRTGRGVEFRRFRVPATSTFRRVEVVDRDGVFLSWLVKKVDTDIPGNTPQAVFLFRAEIGLQSGDREKLATSVPIEREISESERFSGRIT